MERWALIDEKTNEVVNVVRWDGQSSWMPPAGHRVVQSDVLNIGDIVSAESDDARK